MLHINDLSYAIEGRALFDEATAAISEGWKVGFVGPNGSGKSTLLRFIRAEAEGGTHSGAGDAISIRPGARLGHVAQEAPSSQDALLDIVLRHDSERAALLAEADVASDPHRIAEIQTRLADIDAYSAEARAAAILSGLGFDAGAQARPASSFSGGWRMRVALAGVLFAAPDLLLLDEPTNYLDMEGALWLHQFLRRYPYTTLIVSHDRDLLNDATTHILALEERKLSVHPGDYDAYARKSAERRAHALAHSKKQEAKRAHMQAFVDRFRAKASKAKQAQSRLKALERLETVSAPDAHVAAPFRIPSAKPMAPPIVRIEGADLGYDEGRPVLRNVGLRLDQDDRIAILGPNGEGKSTLVKSIAGRLAPLSGPIYRHKKLKVAYFSQHQIDELKPKQNALDHVRALIPEASEAETRAAAASLGFGAQKAETPVEKLSGGEKARLLLGLIAFHGAHLIILDEPTNHLDMGSRERLIEALRDFDGAVLLITHDSHLAGAIADRLWLVNDGAARAYDGDLEDYRALVLNANKAEGAPKPGGGENAREAARRAGADARAAAAPLKKEAERLERRVDELHAILTRLDGALADPDLYKDVSRATKLQKERGALLGAIEDAESDWMAALERYEAARPEA